MARMKFMQGLRQSLSLKECDAPSGADGLGQIDGLEQLFDERGSLPIMPTLSRIFTGSQCEFSGGREGEATDERADTPVALETV